MGAPAIRSTLDPGAADAEGRATHPSWRVNSNLTRPTFTDGEGGSRRKRKDGGVGWENVVRSVL